MFLIFDDIEREIFEFFEVELSSGFQAAKYFAAPDVPWPSHRVVRDVDTLRPVVPRQGGFTQIINEREWDLFGDEREEVFDLAWISSGPLQVSANDLPWTPYRTNIAGNHLPR